MIVRSAVVVEQGVHSFNWSRPQRFARWSQAWQDRAKCSGGGSSHSNEIESSSTLRREAGWWWAFLYNTKEKIALADAASCGAQHVVEA